MTTVTTANDQNEGASSPATGLPVHVQQLCEGRILLTVVVPMVAEAE